MTGQETHIIHDQSLAHLIGSTHPFFTINAETIVNTWALLIVLTILCCLFRFFLSYGGRAQYLVLEMVRTIMDVTKQAIGFFSFNHLSFIATLFIFILFSNTLSIIPWLDEPTNDLNTTLALGLASFVYAQGAAIYQVGLFAYIKGYFSPIFIMFPLNIIGKVSSMISLSFRLFGNIAGGAIIVSMYLLQIVYASIYGQLIGIGCIGLLIALLKHVKKRSSLAVIVSACAFSLFLSPNLLMTLFFGVFEGFLQAFVFTMLSLTYLSSAIQGEGH
jgi:F-type H+-transporting ATPase subunit a